VVGLGSYHTHSRYDDGHGELEEYVRAAMGKGLRALGFSGHAPMPVESDWLMSAENLPRYLAEARRLKAAYAGRLDVLVGLEVDYLPGLSAPRERRVALELDYVLGSVHYLRAPEGGPGWTVDGKPEELDEGVRSDFGGDLQAAVRAYYERLAAMVRDSPPDIVGHFDLVKKNNRRERLFPESAAWYLAAARIALDALERSSCILEVNTGGLLRGTTDAVYPAPRILAECRERRIRVVVNADAHRPEHVDGAYPDALAALRDAGYRSTAVLTASGWREQELDATD